MKFTLVIDGEVSRSRWGRPDDRCLIAGLDGYVGEKEDPLYAIHVPCFLIFESNMALVTAERKLSFVTENGEGDEETIKLSEGKLAFCFGDGRMDEPVMTYRLTPRSSDALIDLVIEKAGRWFREVQYGY